MVSIKICDRKKIYGPFLVVAILNSCNTTHRNHVDSEVKVGHGYNMGVQTESFPVIQFSTSTPGGRSYCSGVFITQNIALTAAHCLLDPRSGGLVEASNITVHSHFVGVKHTMIDTIFIDLSISDAERFTHDIAALWVQLPEGESAPWTDNIKPPVTQNANPNPGDLIEIVGYGKTKVSDTGPATTPRRGRNAIDSVDGDYIRFGSKLKSKSSGDVNKLADAEDSALLSGDSGGPVYWNNQLLGISSWGEPGIGGAGITIKESQFKAINLAGPNAQKFLQKIRNDE